MGSSFGRGPLSLVAILAALAQVAAQTPSLTVTSSAFKEGDKIPKQYASVVGSKNWSPALAWAGAPASTKQFAVIFEDVDAVEFRPRRPRVQWVVYNIPASMTGLPEHLPPRSIIESGPLSGIVQGGSDLDRDARPGDINPTIRTEAQSPGPQGFTPIQQRSSGPTPARLRGQQVMTMAQPATTPRYRGPLSGIDRQPHRHVFTVFAIDTELNLKPGLDKAGLLEALNGHIAGEGRLGVFSIR